MKRTTPKALTVNQELLKIPTTDREQVALWKISSPVHHYRSDVFLTHGTFSNRKVCMGIATFLAEQGYTCWIMEWRSHGESSTAEQPFNFETIAFVDLPATFSYLLEQEQVQQLSCITHSGGGICLSLFLIRHPHYHAALKKITIFGCQAFGAAQGWRNRTKIWIGKQLSRLYGRLPAQATGLGEHDESYFLMKQWFDWNLTGDFVGQDQVNYKEQLKRVRIPILSVCGQGDDFIAPPAGCRQYLEAFQNPDNQFLICGKKQGYLEDYNHGRVLHSSNAAKEIWPKVLEWMG